MTRELALQSSTPRLKSFIGGVGDAAGLFPSSSVSKASLYTVSPDVVPASFLTWPLW